MARARSRNGYRAGAAAVAAISSLFGIASPGCGGGGETGTGGEGTTSSTTTSSSTTTTATGGTGGTGTSTGGTGGTGTSTGGTGGTGTGGSVTKAADSHAALDSTPDSMGDFIYFTGVKAGDASVNKVPANGGTVTELFVGAPLTGAFGISIDSADTNLFVADPGYDVTAGDENTERGAVFTLPVGGGVPTVLAGSAGFRPRGIDVFEETNGDVVYFTGATPMTKEPGVFSLPAAGGTATTIAKGAPFTDPSGIAVGKAQTFVTDAQPTDLKQARVIVIQSGVATVFLGQIPVGYPAGVALSADEKTLYVSSIDPATTSDQVLIIDIATKAITNFTGGGIDQNSDAAGLHRARKKDVFSWADLTAGPSGGSVYKVTFK